MSYRSFVPPLLFSVLVGCSGASSSGDAGADDGRGDLGVIDDTSLDDGAQSDGGDTTPTDDGTSDVGDGSAVDEGPSADDVVDGSGAPDADDTETGVDADGSGADAPDTTADAADAADVPDTAADADTDEAPCAWFEADTYIVACGERYRYVDRYMDAEFRADKCPPYFAARGDEGRHGSIEDAAVAAGCEDTCVWRPSTSVTWLRCGVRSGYIEFASERCGSLFEFPEGLFPSIEAYDAAHPCDVDPRPEGQCVRSSDCPGISICSATAPGGVCTGCGSFADCPESTDECSEFGACRRVCDVDEACPAGQACGVTGYCVIAECMRGACPDPRFDCNAGNRCERRACTTTDDCPDDTNCDGGVCVESR